MAKTATYGTPPRDLAVPEPGSVQVSPLTPGSSVLEQLSDLDQITIYAPPGALERRYVLAQAFRALGPKGCLVALAPKDKGGSRLRKELEAFGVAVEEDARRHHRICACAGPGSPGQIDADTAAGAPRLVEATGMWSQPGVFSWDRIDPGSALLVQHLPALKGRGADLGCGVGYIALKVLQSPEVSDLVLVDNDRRAIEASRLNVVDNRADIRWADAIAQPLEGLDFVVMNPPFHDAGNEDRGLGQAFVRRAAQILRPGGALWVVANRHLPYEQPLNEAFKTVRLVAEARGFKVYEAIR